MLRFHLEPIEFTSSAFRFLSLYIVGKLFFFTPSSLFAITPQCISSMVTIDIVVLLLYSCCNSMALFYVLFVLSIVRCCRLAPGSGN
jgi:hypothetical protein